MIRSTLIAALLFTSTGLFAQQAQMTADALHDCSKNQLAMNICAVEHFKAADHELNTLFQRLLAAIPAKEAKQRLRAAQRAWIAFRDKDCLYQAGRRQDSGSIWITDQYSCLKHHTDRRLDDMKRFLERAAL